RRVDLGPTEPSAGRERRPFVQCRGRAAAPDNRPHAPGARAFSVTPAAAKIGALLVAAVAAGPALAVDPWDITEQSVAFSIADAHWTVDESFPGRKLIVDGRYIVRQWTGTVEERECRCGPAVAPERFLAAFSGHLQWGKGDSELEHGVLRFTAFGSQRD